MNSFLILMFMIVLTPIGYVHNACIESQAPELIKKKFLRLKFYRIMQKV